MVVRFLVSWVEVRVELMVGLVDVVGNCNKCCFFGLRSGYNSSFLRELEVEIVVGFGDEENDIEVVSVDVEGVNEDIVVGGREDDWNYYVLEGFLEFFV